MALNAKDVPGPNYKMWNTRNDIPSTEDPGHILGGVASVAKGAPGGRLKALVFNCHGDNAILHMGTGIGWGQVALFSLLLDSSGKGLVDEIYLVACEVVSFSGPGDGNLFCGAIAKKAQAYVYASNADQNTGLWPSIPFGKIDGFEG